MQKSLRWRALWPWVFTVSIALMLSGAENVNRALMESRINDAISLREQLDRALLYIEDRHSRTVRRAREALLDARAINTTAILSWTSAQYLNEMQRLITESNKIITGGSAADAASRLAGDLIPLQKQLMRIRDLAQETAPIFDALLEATGVNDQDALTAARQDLERTDRDMVALLRTADNIVRAVCARQASRASSPEITVPWVAWLAFGLWLPIGFGLAWVPVRRFAWLARNRPQLKPQTREEEILADRLRTLNHERMELVTQVEERVREAERAQQLARRSDRELALLKFYNENLVNSLRSAIVVTDASGVMTSFNRKARSLLSMDENILGQPIDTHKLYAALNQRTPELRHDLAAAQREPRVLLYDAVAYSELPQAVILDVTLAPYQDESGAARGLLWVADDVTEAVQTKHQLLLTERLAAVGRLSAQVAHEIRNPLSAIGLNAELLEEEFVQLLDSSRQVEAVQLLRAIGSEIERLTEVTEAYLQLARLPRPNLRSCDLNQLLADLFIMQGEDLKTHAVTLVLDLAAPPPRARVDPGQIRQALLNIIRNSREAMADGGVLRIATSITAEGVCSIDISDSGEGIASEVLPRVFEPFYSTKPHGTGLGLSLTQQIIVEHGGTIELSASQLGGTRVVISLPQRTVADDSAI